MIAIAKEAQVSSCSLTRYTLAWSVGTGLQVSLRPGVYRVTGFDEVNGKRFLYLNQSFHCPEDDCDCGGEK